MNRRRFLAVAGLTGAVGIAGCGSTIDSSTGQPSAKDVPPPSVSLPKKWVVQTDEPSPQVFSKGKVAGLDWAAVGTTLQWENKNLRERVKKETFGRIDRPLMIAFASRIDFFPDLAHLATNIKKKKINMEARSTLETKMENFGLSNIKYEGETKVTDHPNTPSYHTYTANYLVDEITINNIDIPNVNRSSFTVGGDDLKVAAILAVWKEGKSMLSAGGIYPAEAYMQSKTWDVTGGIHLTLRIEMGFEPQAYKSEILSILRNVNP